ncbi:MAG: putative ATP-dependent endonuclease of OLD family [Candidatus Paceibacteria bacterium]|jgi:predicted ATP-dependent endonuclease of OLD family
MKLDSLHIRNFRRLRDVVIDMHKDISIFVGSNNSGKTSVVQALQLFVSASREKFSIHDLCASTWSEIEDFANDVTDSKLPEISIDFWFGVNDSDLHKVIDLLPSLDWKEKQVGIRVEFSPTDSSQTLSKFKEAYAAAQGYKDEETEGSPVVLFPKTLKDFLTKELKREYEFRYYVLDRSKFDENLCEIGGYAPLQIISDKGYTGKSKSGKDILSSLIKVDFLQAQRHLSDTSGGARSEDLSRHLSKFYKRNLEKRDHDYKAMSALSESERLMNLHLHDVFSSTMEKLATLGYPGLSNPSIKILSDLNPTTLMSSQDGTQVHYELDRDMTLPDKYNGLGFKNLIYMVVELLDLHNQWMDIEENRPPLHLVFIEEPEAHLHTQLQQVFVNQILDILSVSGPDSSSYSSQIVLTTHSAHILYERGFRPIRYFRREGSGSLQHTTVLNLSEYYDKTENPTKDFLERYLKLTHCDLFFADAAILVEGNVERLLIPLMINKSAPRLKQTCISVLEIGGAFGYRFQSLIDFLGITSLVITDLDSVIGPTPEEDNGEDEESDEFEDIDEEEDGEASPKKGTTCPVEVDNAVTSNQTLIQWLPAKKTINELLQATKAQKTQIRDSEHSSVYVCYQSQVTIVRDTDSIARTGRTLEETFAYENLVWSQNIENKDLKIRVKSSDTPTLEVTADRIYKRVSGKNFKKTDFALALLAKNQEDWVVPSYIQEGIEWLEKEVVPKVKKPVSEVTPKTSVKKVDKTSKKKVKNVPTV